MVSALESVGKDLTSHKIKHRDRNMICQNEKELVGITKQKGTFFQPTNMSPFIHC